MASCKTHRKKTTKWLKKYTRLDYLEGILKDRQLHLSPPECWPDKNDAVSVQTYASVENIDHISATCLTGSADRYHFWHIFGDLQKGVCLWFDRDSLINDIKEDRSLIANDVEYYTPKKVRRISPSELPFAKREQYRDEREFRVLRVSAPKTGPIDKFQFTYASLKKIYLNPWLAACCVKQEKARIGEMLGGRREDFAIEQNRSLQKKEWIEAVKSVARKL